MNHMNKVYFINHNKLIYHSIHHLLLLMDFNTRDNIQIYFHRRLHSKSIGNLIKIIIIFHLWLFSNMVLWYLLNSIYTLFYISCKCNCCQPQHKEINNQLLQQELVCIHLTSKCIQFYIRNKILSSINNCNLHQRPYRDLGIKQNQDLT